MFSNFPALKGFLAFLEKDARGSALRSHRPALKADQACRIARRRWRLSIALMRTLVKQPLVMDASKLLLASSLGIRPSQESNARIVRVERHDDGIGPNAT